MNGRVFLIACFLPVIAWAQSFGGLGSKAAEEFATPQRNFVFDFPTDHGPHPDYRIEWWYLTANLEDPAGVQYGLQWTLFRTAVAPGEEEGWSSPQVWFAHAAVTTPEAHFSTERFARGGIGQAGVTVEPFRAWIDEWRLEGPDMNSLSVQAASPDFAFDMDLLATGPLVFHGENGFSQKSADGQASYYYSQPFYKISGTLNLPEGDIPVTGSAWLDREWSSQPLSDDQKGWDWFSLSFEDGEKMMGFQLRQSDGSQYTSATWIDANGETQSYPDGAFMAEPLEETRVAGRDIPIRWRVRLSDRDLDAEVLALTPKAWMDVSIPYWEGPVGISGSHSGRGYLEMTGYQ